MRKKRILFLGITMFLLFFILHPDLSAKANVNLEEEGRSAGTYIYPSFDTPEWKQYTTAEERIAACRIPKEILEEMTEEQLVQAVYDFPFLVNIFVYSALKDALAVLALYQEDIVEKMSAEEVQIVASFSSMVDAGYVEEIIADK